MSVTISHPTIVAKTVTLKTTPSTPLKQLVVDAVTKWNLGNPDGFGLKHGKNILDLTLNIRFSNLAQGAKLALIPTRAAASGPVTVALQTPEGGRLVDKFPVATTLWTILTTWEERDANLNITRKTSVEERGMKKVKKEVYQMPVCIFMNKEYSTIQALQSTTLQNAGLTTGNGVIRVLLKPTDMTIEEALQTNAPSPPAIPSSTVDDKNAAPSAVQPPAVPTSAQAAPPTPPSPKTTIANAEHPTPMDISDAAPSSMPPSIPMEIDGTPDIKANGSSQQEQPTTIAVVETPAAASEPMDISDTTESHTSQADAAQVGTDHGRNHPAPGPANQNDTPVTQSSAAEPSKGFDRGVQVFAPPPVDAPYHQVELPDSFYDLTSTELKLLLASTSSSLLANGSSSSRDAPLMTRAMREREAALKLKKHPKTLIRVKFPDRVMVQLSFLSSEAVQTLYTCLTPMLRTPTPRFTLYITPPYQELDPRQTFWEAKLAPNSMVHFKWAEEAANEHNADGSAEYLNEEWKGKLSPLPVPETAASAGVLGGIGVAAAVSAAGLTGGSNARNGPTTSSSSTSPTSKRPKWLPKAFGNTLSGSKKSPSSSSESLQQQQGSSSSLSEQDQQQHGLYGDERDGHGSSSAQRSPPPTGRPKWFKMGK
ncbi:uncharacterized protein EV422DRAFT_511123 [Fimicolochytrium jonesii]|uniref:uncharacterized protein n=1 Tax=Fimicolochytrium jonesii TaxID=1396493 RepID=UPI0022FEC353|nr:uncharacterized protein EV422DRAFT_511123 [Fimicolochytrium jonesii]KAI8826709.1 hypothetical protein EV422DRAFT_511123 [Fimicolochytrium jonesii]